MAVATAPKQLTLSESAQGYTALCKTVEKAINPESFGRRSSVATPQSHSSEGPKNDSCESINRCERGRRRRSDPKGHGSLMMVQ